MRRRAPGAATGNCEQTGASLGLAPFDRRAEIYFAKALTAPASSSFTSKTVYNLVICSRS